MKQEDNPLLEKELYGNLIGKNPLTIDDNLLKEARHSKTSLAKVIRKRCLDCSGFSPGEVRKCVATDCPSWPYRMGKNPFQKHNKKQEG